MEAHGQALPPGPGREMTFEEKRKLSHAMGSLSGERLVHVLQIIAEGPSAPAMVRRRGGGGCWVGGCWEEWVVGCGAVELGQLAGWCQPSPGAAGRQVLSAQLGWRQRQEALRCQRHVRPPALLTVLRS